MILIIPWRTDALIEHRPWATAAIILTNIAVALTIGYVGFEEFYFFPPEPFEANRWAVTGGEFDPLTWVTSLFLHFNGFHLGFNMLFLWVFGLVVEGAVGWRKFLAIYLTVGILGGAIGQALMHMIGVLIGAPLAILFLRRGWVDCQGWDWFSVRRKRRERRSAIVPRNPEGLARLVRGRVSEDEPLN